VRDADLAAHPHRFKRVWMPSSDFPKIVERTAQGLSAAVSSLCNRECSASLPARIVSSQICSDRPRQSVTKPPASRTSRQPAAVSHGFSPASQKPS